MPPPEIGLLGWTVLCLPLGLGVLKRSVPKTLAFAFGLRLRSKTQRSKTRVLGKRLPNGKSQERSRFRDLRGKTLTFKKRMAIISRVLEASHGARACVQVLCVQKNAAFCVCVLKPTELLGLASLRTVMTTPVLHSISWK